MKGKENVNDIRRKKVSITASDAVADWCCCAKAELLRSWSLMDGSFAGLCLFCC